MKQLLKSLGKKTALVAITALFAGVATTAAVFAAIPNSSTGLISACRNNLTGALRAIDAQVGATCGFGSTALSWPSTNTGDGDSTHSALLRLKPDPSDPANYVIDNTRSRNVLDVKTVADPNPENADYRSLCVKLTFTPEVKVVGSVDVLGGGSLTNISIVTDGEATAGGITGVCGSGYHGIAFLNPNSGDAVGRSFFFSN